jgi:hypothetical protein
MYTVQYKYCNSIVIFKIQPKEKEKRLYIQYIQKLS